MSTVKTRRLVTICVVVVVSLLTLSFFHYPYGPSQLSNVESTVEVAPSVEVAPIVEVAPEPKNTSQPEPLPVVSVVPVDLFGVESNLVGPPTPKFRGELPSSLVDSPSDLSTTDNLRSDRKYITSFISAGWSTSQSLSTLSSLLIASSSQRCHDLCEPTSHSTPLSLTCTHR